jgi:tRNA (adenine37-N6)-methyltransferase
VSPGEPFAVRPIGRVRSTRTGTSGDGWDGEPASIELNASFRPEALAGLDALSHAELLFVFDRVAESSLERGARHPHAQPCGSRRGRRR